MKWLCLFSVIAITIICQLTLALQCYTPGECLGGQITDFIEDVQTYNDCLRLCQEDPDADCQWFTHFQSKVCLHFDGCPSINQECTDCFSGERNCPRETICNAQGGCDGTAIGYPAVQNVQECRKACYETPGCEWYTYLPGPHFCTLTEDCPEIDFNCNGDECVHGEKACFLQESKSLLVVGGYSYGGPLSDVEVLDLGSNSSCILSSYPGRRQGPFGTILDGEITICGGYDGINGTRYDDCYVYNPGNNMWEETTPLLDPRSGSGGIMLNDSAWWIAGGHFGRTTIETELKLADGGSIDYIDLPEPFGYTHFFKINDTHAVLTKAQGFTQAVYLFDIQKKEWSSLPDIPVEFNWFQAGFVKFPNETRMIIVAGGYVNENYCYGLNLDSLEWMSLPKLPTSFGGACVQLDDTFYIVGGHSEPIAPPSPGISYLNSIFEFDVYEEKWKELPQKLNVSRKTSAALLIPSNMINCDAINQK